MFQDQILFYIRENQMMLTLIGEAVVLLLLLVVFIQVSRTRREVHKICKKIRKYFEVILAEPTEKEPDGQALEDEQEEVPIYQTPASVAKQLEQTAGAEKLQKEQRDAKLLMDIIQEVF